MSLFTVIITPAKCQHVNKGSFSLSIIMLIISFWETKCQKVV